MTAWAGNFIHLTTTPIIIPSPYIASLKTIDKLSLWPSQCLGQVPPPSIKHSHHPGLALAALPHIRPETKDKSHPDKHSPVPFHSSSQC